jgi:hypothetical protein
MVVDGGAHAGAMPAFVRERLDVCGRELGFDWRQYLTVNEPN